MSAKPELTSSFASATPSRSSLRRPSEVRAICCSLRTAAANAVQAGANDAAIVWDAVAANYPSLAVVQLPELEGAVGAVEIAVLRSATDAEAARKFVQFVRAANRGQKAFRAAGFTDLE